MESYHQHNEQLAFVLDIKDRLLEERKIALNDAWDFVAGQKIRFLNKLIDACEHEKKVLETTYEARVLVPRAQKNAEVVAR